MMRRFALSRHRNRVVLVAVCGLAIGTALALQPAFAGSKAPARDNSAAHYLTQRQVAQMRRLRRASRRDSRTELVASRRAISRSEKRRVASTLARHFGVFRFARSADAGPTLPSAVAASLASVPQQLNVAAARFIVTGSAPATTPIGKSTGVWLVPGAQGVCVFDADFGGTCSGLAGPGSPASGGLRATSSTGDGTETVMGLVPDGNTSVSVVMSDGSVDQASVVDNVYSITVSGVPAKLIAKDVSGVTKTFVL